MQPLFSTEGIHHSDAFRRWRAMIVERLAPAEMQALEDTSFQGRPEAANIGSLLLTRTFHNPVRTEAPSDALRRNGRQDRQSVVSPRPGRSVAQQGNREALNDTGYLGVLGSDPTVHMTDTSRHLVLELPRERPKSVLGSARLFAGLTVGADLASATLAGTYFKELVRVGNRLTPDAATRMASIGFDLIVASLAERIAPAIAAWRQPPVGWPMPHTCRSGCWPMATASPAKPILPAASRSATG